MTTPPWLDDATRALNYAVAGKFETSTLLIERIANKHGEDMPMVLLAWIDTLIDAVGAPTRGDNLVLTLFADPATGKFVTADDVPREIAWAGRLATARALDDEPMARALFASVTGDDEWADNVLAVLNVCSTMLRKAGWGPAVKAATGS